MGLVSRRPEDEEEDQDGSEIMITGFGDLEGNGPTPVALDLTTWGEGGRTALDERLHLLEAPHAWNGVLLVIDEADVPWIARIIEQVEDDRTLALDPEADQIAYDLDGWDDLNLSLLVHGLQDKAIAFKIEDGELVVQETDEQGVDELVETILEPDGSTAPEGEARAELMGELFVIADRLTHDPRDAAVRDELAAATTEIVESGPPYGVEPGWWTGIGERCTALGALLDPSTLDDDEVTTAAAALRGALRGYV